MPKRRTPKAQVWTAGSYNVSGEKRPQAYARLSWLLGTHPTLTWVGLQEAKWVGKKPVPLAGRARGFRRTRKWHHDNQIMFRNARGFRGTGSRVFVLARGDNHWIEPAAAGPTRADTRILNVLLGVQDGVKTARMSIHLVPSIHFPKADRLSEDQIESLANVVRHYQARGFEIELLGDFNMPPDHENLKPLLRRGLRVVNRDWTHSKGTRATQRQIDLVLISDGIETVADRTIFGHRVDDHRIVLVRLRMKPTTIRKVSR